MEGLLAITEEVLGRRKKDREAEGKKDNPGDSAAAWAKVNAANRRIATLGVQRAFQKDWKVPLEQPRCSAGTVRHSKDLKHPSTIVTHKVSIILGSIF